MARLSKGILNVLRKKLEQQRLGKEKKGKEKNRERRIANSGES